jgi:chromosome partitioning protein
MPFVVAVAAQKGGVGKTTVASNLAAAAHLSGCRTLLLDMDVQGSAFDWFHARAKGSKLTGLAVVKADRPVAGDQFRDIVRGYDFVVCDGPPRVDAITRAAAIHSDLVLLPMRAGPLDWWATEQTVRVLADAAEVRKQFGYPALRCLFVLNAMPSRSRIVGAARDAIATHLATFSEVTGGSFDILPEGIGNRVAFPTAMFTGESVLTLDDPGASGAEIIRLFDTVKSAAADAQRRAA